MIFQKIVKKKNLYRQIARVLNGLNDLSPREMEIFGILLKIDANWRPVLQTETKNILTRETRKAIMKETFVNKNNLSKYISVLKDKGLVVKNIYDGYQIHEMFVPKLEDGVVKINFTMGVEDEE